ncbi:MAG: hypothetical protein HN731_00545 [Rhodospirillaceae bacterium]|nr:hypothetical protein [Rhodospirillaceae bacterium]
MRTLRSIFMPSLFAVAIILFSGPSFAAYYTGKTIAVLVGFPPGSSATLVVRNFIPFWSKHTPGNPQFVVKNKPGAGGQNAVNLIYEKGDKKGLTILFSPSKIAGEVMNARGQRAVHNNFEILGLVYDKHMTFSLTKVGPGLKKPADIVKANGIKMAARSPSSTLDVTGKAALDLLGVKYKFVCCYRGAAKMYAAMLTNEAHLGNVGISGYRSRYEPNLVKKGQAIGLYYLPTLTPKGDVITQDPELPDMPALSELYKELNGKEPSGTLWEGIKWLRMASPRMAVAAPGTNKQAVADLRKGFIAAQKDPEFIAAHEKRFGSKWIYFSGEEGAGVFNKIKNADPAVVKLLSTKYFVSKAKGKKGKKK